MSVFKHFVCSSVHYQYYILITLNPMHKEAFDFQILKNVPCVI